MTAMIARVLARLLLSLGLLAAAPVSAQETVGRWALQADGTTLMIFEVTRGPAGWSGAWQRPSHFRSDGDTFTGVSGPVQRRIARVARQEADGVTLTFAEPADGTSSTAFTIRPQSASSATLFFVGFGEEPALLTRVDAGVKLGSWDANKTYIRPVARPTNAEMTALFDADQTARRDPHIDWVSVGAADKRRRLRTLELLAARQLHSGDDFYHAAYVMQHGHDPDDYLKAHALAIVAAASGKPAAAWIAAASLDRYLQSIGQPQVYGTQFTLRDGKWSQQPFRPELLPDVLRSASRVPVLAEQKAPSTAP